VEDWAEIRRLHRAEGLPVRAIARRLGVGRNTVRRALASDGPPRYRRPPGPSIVDAGLQDLLHGQRVGERERTRSPASTGYWPFGCFEGLADSDVPLVALVGLPHRHHQAPGRVQRSADVGERGDRVVEEHRAEPADRQVEAFRRKAVDLRVCMLEGDVAESFPPGPARGLA
jgi:Helix-turn-helix domain